MVTLLGENPQVGWAYLVYLCLFDYHCGFLFFFMTFFGFQCAWWSLQWQVLYPDLSYTLWLEGRYSHVDMSGVVHNMLAWDLSLSEGPFEGDNVKQASCTTLSLFDLGAWEAGDLRTLNPSFWVIRSFPIPLETIKFGGDSCLFF